MVLMTLNYVYFGSRLQDRDGQATIIALRPIRKGEEVGSSLTQHMPVLYPKPIID